MNKKVCPCHSSQTRRRVVFVSGIGKLHIVQAARDLKRYAPEVEVILATSWIPSARVLKLMKSAGLGAIAKRLEVRRAAAAELDEAIGFLLPELVYLVLRRVIGAERALGLGFMSFGYLAARRLRRMLCNDTILHIRSGAGFELIDTARRAGAKVCVDHSIAHPKSFANFLADVENFIPSATLVSDSMLWRQVLRDCEAADLLVVNSDFVRQTFIDNGYDCEKIAVIYLGVPETFFDVENQGSPTKFDLLFSGHFDARKGCDLLVQMMHLLAERAPDVRLHVAGQISQSGQAILDKFGAPPNTVFYGYLSLEELKELCAKADAFVFPTYLEGSARSVAEAMAAGLPVITTPQSGAPITDGATGILLETHSPQAWCESVLELRRNPEVAARIAESARIAMLGFSGTAYAANLLTEFERQTRK
nr:glycosyltransferase family 4 protein [uncultured Celeribacter sp.]